MCRDLALGLSYLCDFRRQNPIILGKQERRYKIQSRNYGATSPVRMLRKSLSGRRWY
jgi:hypothetical protein